MANRVDLGGHYPSQGEDSFGQLRARHWIEYPSAMVDLIQEIQIENPGYDGPREVLADIVAGEFDDLLAERSEVDPEKFDREEWVESQEESDD